MTTFVNLIGGPGIGKSMTAYGLSYFMKSKHETVEYLQEFVKSLVLRKEFELLKDQQYIAEQSYRLMSELNNTVDYVIMDGPLIMGLYYNRYYAQYNPDVDFYILDALKEFKCINVFLEREHKVPYETNGRFQSKDEACLVDDKMYNLLKEEVDLECIPVQLLGLNLANTHIERIYELIKKKS